MREDVLGDIMPQLHNTTEFRDLIYRLPWRIDQLMDLLGTRLSAALGEDYSPEWLFETKQLRLFSSEMFHAVFERSLLDGYTPFRYFVTHTHMRPRDLIEVCNSCRKEAAASQKQIIDGSAINRGMWNSSATSYLDLVAGYRYMVSDFQQVVDSFRHGPLRFSRTELISRLQALASKREFLDATQDDRRLDADHLISVLYKAGFLVAPVDDDSGGGLPFVAYHIDPHRTSEAEQGWLIHPAYWREMSRGKAAPNLRQVLAQKL